MSKTPQPIKLTPRKGGGWKIQLRSGDTVAAICFTPGTSGSEERARIEAEAFARVLEPMSVPQRVQRILDETRGRATRREWEQTQAPVFRLPSPQRFEKQSAWAITVTHDHRNVRVYFPASRYEGSMDAALATAEAFARTLVGLTPEQRFDAVSRARISNKENNRYGRVYTGVKYVSYFRSEPGPARFEVLLPPSADGTGRTRIVLDEERWGYGPGLELAEEIADRWQLATTLVRLKAFWKWVSQYRVVKKRGRPPKIRALV